MNVTLQVESFVCPHCGKGLDNTEFNDWSPNNDARVAQVSNEEITCETCDIKFMVDVEFKVSINQA